MGGEGTTTRSTTCMVTTVTTETTLYTAVAGDKTTAAIFNIEHIMQIKAVSLVQLTDVNSIAFL